MGCDERWARGGGRGTRLARSGLVHIGFAGGYFGCAGLLLVGWRAAEVVTELSQRCETCWDAGGYVETVSAGRRAGRDELGQVNMASR